jgi:predicted glycosyltransferase
VLGLRDIVDAPEVVNRVWAEEGAFDALETYYDAVLVYGRKELFDPVREYGFPPSVAKRVHYTGHVCTPDRGRYTATLRARAARNGAGFLVATAGGGADGYPMMSAVLDALPVLEDHQPWSAVLITGPFMPSHLRRDLQRRAGKGAKVRQYVSDPLSYVEAADVVVAMAGYSSTVEAMRSGTPTVLVPRRGPSAEQRMRTSQFTGRGWTASVDPDHLTGAAVASAVLERLSTPAAPAPEPCGLANVVRHLVTMLDGRATTAPVPVQVGRAEALNLG